MEKEISPEEDRAMKLIAARQCAMAEAMREVMQEQSAEIVKRARAKLVAMGIQVQDDEAGA